MNPTWYDSCRDLNTVCIKLHTYVLVDGWVPYLFIQFFSLLPVQHSILHMIYICISYLNWYCLRWFTFYWKCKTLHASSMAKSQNNNLIKSNKNWGLRACLFLCPPGVSAGGALAHRFGRVMAVLLIISGPKPVPVRGCACLFLCPAGISAGRWKGAISSKGFSSLDFHEKEPFHPRKEAIS